MVPVLIIAAGNPMRTDDAIGLAVLDELQKINLPMGYRFMAVEDPFFIPELLYLAQRVVVLDALPPAGTPGQVIVFPNISNGMFSKTCYSLHDLDLLWQIQYAVKNGYTGEVLLIGIEAACLDMGWMLSDSLKMGLPRITEEVDEIIKQFNTSPCSSLPELR